MAHGRKVRNGCGLPEWPQDLRRPGALSFRVELELEQGMDSIEEARFSAVWSGGDERILLDPVRKVNRYGLNPIYHDNMFYRGSCTCGTLTQDTRPIAEQALDRWNNTSDTSTAWAEEQRGRLEALIGGRVPFDTFFAPSGTDLLYLPLLIARAMSDRPILNVLSCPEELGSGSRLAVAGKYFSRLTATGAEADQGAAVSAELVGEVVELPARDEHGHVMQRKSAIEWLIRQHQDKTVIVHLVFGSKSGIRDDLDVIAARPHVLWTVDLCQFRADPELIGYLLAKGVMVLITGSKFYQAPPFCGALLAPAMLSDAAGPWPVEAAKTMGKIFVKSDFPLRFKELREAVPVVNNPGSRLRWECALWQMEACDRVDRAQFIKAIEDWNANIVEAIASLQALELIPDQAKTNDSIVSFRVRAGGRYFNREDMDVLFRTITTKDWTEEFGWKRIFIGQPVNYGERAFIRVALGAQAARLAVEQGNGWSEDRRMMGLIARTAETMMGLS